MRKFSVSCLLLGVMMIVSSACWAVDFGLKAGAHVPVGDYGDGADTGFTLGGQVGAAITDNLSAGLALNYNMADLSDVDGDVTMIEILPFLDYNLAPEKDFNLFVRGGMGANKWKLNSDTWFVEDDDGVDFMAALGCGVRIMQHVEFLVLYNRMFDSDEDADYVNCTIGYNF
jgi:opacity protein-like surface antigen